MGAVFRPKDLPSSRKKIIENAVRDFSPYVKDDVVKILDSWENRINRIGGKTQGNTRPR
jgi:hypothetical protein